MTSEPGQGRLSERGTTRTVWWSPIGRLRHSPSRNRAGLRTITGSETVERVPNYYLGVEIGFGDELRGRYTNVAPTCYLGSLEASERDNREEQTEYDSDGPSREREVCVALDMSRNRLVCQSMHGGAPNVPEYESCDSQRPRGHRGYYESSAHFVVLKAPRYNIHITAVLPRREAVPSND